MVPPVAVIGVELPTHIEGLPAAAVTVILPTLTVIDAVDVHPLVSVPVTTYVVVAVGVDTTESPVAGFKPVTGDHEYVFAPDAESITESPEHTAGLAGAVVSTGKGFTVTVTVVESLQPLPDLPTTV